MTFLISIKDIIIAAMTLGTVLGLLAAYFIIKYIDKGE